MGGRHGRCFDDELAFIVFLILHPTHTRTRLIHEGQKAAHSPVRPASFSWMA